MHSSFEEVIAIDADNIPLHDPKIIFETEQYKETGNLYWRDFRSRPLLPMHIFEKHNNGEYPQNSFDLLFLSALL